MREQSLRVRVTKCIYIQKAMSRISNQSRNLTNDKNNRKKKSELEKVYIMVFSGWRYKVGWVVKGEAGEGWVVDSNFPLTNNICR